jgi:hypothetical protein
MTRKLRASARPPIILAISRQSLPHSREPVSRRLGGVTLWAPTAADHQSGIRGLSDAIAECAGAHLTATKTVLRTLVRKQLPDSDVEDRVFAAVLGFTLRIGLLDAIVCASEKDKPYRVFIHRTQLSRFANALETATVLLRRSGTTTVPVLETALFGTRSYNTWSSTSHVLARLSYLGLARIGGEGRCSLVTEIT